MSQNNIEARDRYYAEVSLKLSKAGFAPQPQEDGYLPVDWNGSRLCRLTTKDGVLYKDEDVERSGGREALDRLIDMTNKSLYTNVSVTKRGYVEVMPGQLIRYDFSNIANNSTTALESFYWRDTLPTNAVRLDKIVTGTWNANGNYKIVYKTNYSGDEHRVLADNLATNRSYILNASPAALGLASGEYVTEFMAVFGVVPSNFRQVEAPQVYCTVLSTLANGTEFVNVTDVGGLYNGQWIMAVDRWTTRVYAPSKPLPRTGY